MSAAAPTRLLGLSRKEQSMRKEIDKLKKRIGARKFKEVEAFVKKRKAEGKSPDEIKAAFQAKFPELADVYKVIRIEIPETEMP
jgi:hypothetical protein